MKKTRTLKAKADQITYVQVGNREDGLPNLVFAFSVRAGKVTIFQVQPLVYGVNVYGVNGVDEK